MIIGLDERTEATLLTNISFEKASEEKFSYIYRGRHDLLDHVLISRSLRDRVKEVSIKNEGLVDQSELREEDILASDHAPVVMELG
jgi:predicted extracellular nuclease